MIGWAFDSTGAMKPFDGPALAAAKVRIGQVNAKGGVSGRPLQIKTCDTNGNNPAKAKSCAASLLGGGAKIMFVTCDVDYATPVVQEAINRGVLAIAPCIGTDQMGPKRFGTKGKLAFSFGNVAQDEGSAMAEYAFRKGWRTASLATNTALVYFKNVVQAFDKRFRQLGGSIVARESYATGANNVQNAVSRLNGRKADVIVTSTAFGELPALVSGLRSLRNQTPILNSWAGDGTYWVPKSPPVTNYYAVTFASVFGDDPIPAVRSARETAEGGHRRLRHRLGGDRRCRDGDQALERVDERRDTRRDDGEVQEGADAVGSRQLLGEIPHRLRSAVPGDQDREQQGPPRRPGDSQGRPDAPVGRLTTDAAAELRRRPGGTLRASAVSRSFTGVQALSDVTLELHRHEVVGLIGPNGAGKSTLVNVLSGFDLPSSGSVELEDRDVTGWSPHRRGRAGIARTFQHSRSFRGLTVRENVEVAALGVGRRPRAARRRADELLELLGLGARGEVAAGTLAHGDERRLGVARALATEPQLRADGRARGRPAGGGSPGVRRSHAGGARRPRRRRAPDRPQHGARDGGLRSHPRARPRPDARRGLAGRDPWEHRRRGRLPRRERGHGWLTRCSSSTGSRCATERSARSETCPSASQRASSSV